MNLLKTLLSRQWLLTTLLVLAATAIMVRLGIWQLDRLTQRREFNARAMAWVNGPELALAGAALEEDLYNMEYRPVRLRGEYLFENQVLLRNQQSGTRLGMILLTPMRLDDGSGLMLVARGWIPQKDGDISRWSAYDQPGPQEVAGVLRRSEPRASIGSLPNPTLMPGEARLLQWYSVDVGRIASENNLPLLADVYVQVLPTTDSSGSLPQPLALELEISEGSHAGYAGQWFTFAAILLIGYPVFVRRQTGLGLEERKHEK